MLWRLRHSSQNIIIRTSAYLLLVTSGRLCSLLSCNLPLNDTGCLCLSSHPDGCFVLFQRGEEHHRLVTLSGVPTSGSIINLPQQLCPRTCLSLCKGDGKSFSSHYLPPGICSFRLSHLTCALTLRLSCWTLWTCC